MRIANKTNNLSIISFTMKGIITSDKLFTIPGVIIITAGGFSAAIQGGLPLLRTGWIFWSIILFTLSGLVFSWKLAPLQKKIFQLIKNTDAAKLIRSFIMPFKAMGDMGADSITYTFGCIGNDGA